MNEPRQDISHVLASAFKDLYTEGVLEEDMATNWIESQGGDSVYQDSYTDELEKLLAEYRSRLTEADRAEKEIIRAQARAKREEARVLKQMKIHAGKDFPKLGLPPGESEPGYLKGTHRQRAFSLDETIYLPDSVTSESSALSSVQDSSLEAKTISKKTKDSQKRARKESKSWKAEELSEYLSRLEKRQNYLKNPRFFPPNTLDGGKSLVISQDKVEEIIARRKAEDAKGYAVFHLLSCFCMIKLGRFMSAWNTLDSENIELLTFSRQKSKWLGEMIALELLFVTGGESKALLGEVTDATAQHLIRFEPQNPRSTKDKILVIRNSTNLELPFFWQITKPNLKPLIPEETADCTEVKNSQDPESAFSLNPEQGVLLPYADHEFILTYAPQELKSYHSVLQMIVRNTPDSPCLVEERMLQNIPECRVEDVIALKIEVKGSTEPYNLLLEPYAIIIPGENFIGVNVKKKFKLWNNSKTLIKYTWERITDCEIIEVEPRTGVIDVNFCCEFLLAISGSKPGVISRKLPCHVELCPEPVMLHIEAAFKGPSLCIDVPSLQFGLTKQGETVSRTFEINNLSQVPAQWRMQESQVFLAQRNEEVSTFTIQPSAGEIPPLGLCTVSVHFTSLQCQRLQTVLELEVENGEGSHLPVFVEVQTPQVCLISSHLVFNEIYTGVPVKATNKLFNQTLLPAKYLWGKPIGSQAASCSVVVSPASGTLGPNEEREFCIELSTDTVGELKDLTLCCSIEDMAEPLFLSISGEVKGLHVTYSVASGSGADSDEGQMPQSPCELLLDFGSEVAVKDVVKHQLILTNLSGIRAPFTLEAEYFSACLVPPEQGACLYLVKKRGPVTEPAARKVKSEFAAALLSQGKGAAFHIQPSSGTLEAFQQLTIEIAAYNNMWGEYQDYLVCKVGHLQPKLIPMQMTVKGCPIFLQVTGPKLEPPIVRFGTQISGGSPVLRRVQLNNPTPFDIRLDLEVYNQEPDDEKLVDLLVLFGDPFPPLDMAGKEAASSGSPSESKVVLKLDPAAIPCGSIYPALESTDECNSFNHSPPLCLCSLQVLTAKRWKSAARSLQERKISLYSSDLMRGCLQTAPTPLLQGRYRVPRFLCNPRRLRALNALSRPQVVPGGGSSDIYISFTPLVIPDTEAELCCAALLLGFMSLDSKLARGVPSKVRRSHVYDAPPLRVHVEAVLRHPLLEVEMDHERGMVFYSVASDLLPAKPFSGLVPVTAYLTVPVLELSCDRVDFQSCFVAQTKTEHVFLYNRSGCRSYWTALLGILVLQLISLLQSFTKTACTHSI
ncbi:hypothetical protein EK904_005558 [Melospiza melodia maxima]|nr:hypothetical protein EK904_005558 [Melospiza melodia maxima]